MTHPSRWGHVLLVAACATTWTVFPGPARAEGHPASPGMSHVTPAVTPAAGNRTPTHPAPVSPKRPNPANPAAPSQPVPPTAPSPSEDVPGPEAQRPSMPAPLPPPTPGLTQPQFSPYVPWPTSKLRVRVIDGRTQQPIEGAEVVLIETEQRATTGPDGYTQWMDAPIIRNPRYRPMVAELHGQLGVIAYKNGYRDSIHLGIRMHEGLPSETTVWMYKLGPGDTRIEPVLYQVPYHHVWLVELADKFRSKTQPGEGPERP
ncbi:hypothetical protein [Alicyclobacillus sp.]|uniref:hypothetical protein n=1 Tax=Alicyclobacillus sp. TaxID=61169 RepID=UPI0025C0B77F|nr:hypothetical protein [Alicyclobacillus sp.]